MNFERIECLMRDSIRRTNNCNNYSNVPYFDMHDMDAVEYV